MNIFFGILIVACSFAIFIGSVCAWLTGSVSGAYLYAFTLVFGLLALGGMVFLGLKVMGVLG